MISLTKCLNIYYQWETMNNCWNSGFRVILILLYQAVPTLQSWEVHCVFQFSSHPLLCLDYMYLPGQNPISSPNQTIYFKSLETNNGKTKQNSSGRGFVRNVNYRHYSGQDRTIISEDRKSFICFFVVGVFVRGSLRTFDKGHHVFKLNRKFCFCSDLI